MQNLKIRKYAESKKVYLWQIAMKMNMTDSNFSRKLRKELSAEESSKIKHYIDEISKENEEMD